MTELADIALLPAGLEDGLPPAAAFEAQAVERLLAAFAARGYERVKPPLLEFEESLFAGSGTATVAHAFRLMDPVSQRMMALRPDMTPQVARIATTRLGRAPRPLRLGYAGQILRVKGSQLRPGRQFGQAGAELIGAPEPAGDVEVIVMAVEALRSLGVADLTVDLGMPTLVPALLAGLDVRPGDGAAARLREVLDRKDVAAVAELAPDLGRPAVDLLGALLGLTGPAEQALQALAGLDLPPPAVAARRALEAVVSGLRAEVPDLTLTVDPVENRGFEYHTGATFTLFGRGVSGELGRGGRYLAGVGDDRVEPAAGLTLFMDTVLQALPAPPPPRRVFLPAGTGAQAGRRLRDEGWTTIAGLAPADDAEAEARRMGCSHLWTDGGVVEIKDR